MSHRMRKALCSAKDNALSRQPATIKKGERERERAKERDCILFCNHSKSSRSSQALDRQSQVEEKEPQYHHEIVSEPVRT